VPHNFVPTRPFALSTYPHPRPSQEKDKLDRQLKQHAARGNALQGQLEKAGAQAEKRRESMMVGLSKTKEQLGGAEERARQLSLDLQRTQMDLVAKSGECSGLEKQLADARAAEGGLASDKAALEAQLGAALASLAATQARANELQGERARRKGRGGRGC
jgi:chromosome segregation ATPase